MPNGYCLGIAARCYSQRKASGWVGDRTYEVAESRRLARRAVELGRDDAVALCTAGIALAFVVGDSEVGDALIDRALSLNPNLAWAWLFSAWVKAWGGDPEAAIERASHAMRLSPQDPHIHSMEWAVAFAHFIAGRYVEALAGAESATPLQPNASIAVATIAVCGALTGQIEKAAAAMARLREGDPGLLISNLRDRFPIKRDEDFARWTEGLRKAGLPE